KIAAIRDGIGVALHDDIDKAAQVSDTEAQLAAAMLIAEIADTEFATDAKKLKESRKTMSLARKKGEMEFARSFESVVAGLAKSPELMVRQAALNALGKIT